MAGVERVRGRMKGIRALRTTPAAQAWVNALARQVAAEAQVELMKVPGRVPDYVAHDASTATRARATVVLVTKRANLAESKHHHVARTMYRGAR